MTIGQDRRGRLRAAELAGNAAKASEYYSKLIDLAREGDDARAELATAREFLAKRSSAVPQH